MGTCAGPRTVEVRTSRTCVLVDVPLREAGERLLDHDLGFEPGQARAEAEVDAVAERHVAVEGALDVEAVGIGVLALVAAGAAGEQRDLRVRGNGRGRATRRRG